MMLGKGINRGKNRLATNIMRWFRNASVEVCSCPVLNIVSNALVQVDKSKSKIFSINQILKNLH